MEDSSILLGDGAGIEQLLAKWMENAGCCGVAVLRWRSCVPLNGHGARISLTLPEYLLQKHVCPRPFQAEVTLCQKPSNHKPPDI